MLLLVTFSQLPSCQHRLIPFRLTCSYAPNLNIYFLVTLNLALDLSTVGRSWGLKNRSYNSAFYRRLQLLIKRINKDHIIVLCGFTESRRLLGTNPFYHFVFYLLYTIMVCINCCHHILFIFFPLGNHL